MIEFRNVTKIYRPLFGRPVRAVDEFSLSVEEGEIVGLAGPNGAGKSTLISLLLGFLRPTSGTVAIGGHAPRNFIERYGIGYMSELVAIPPAWLLGDALDRYALLAGVADSGRRTRVDSVIEQLGIQDHRSKRVRHLSKGNLQRLGLAQVLLREEAIYVFDEPTHGLDPVWTQRFREVLQGLRGTGRATLIASHNLDELERVSDRVAIIDRGRLQRLVDTRHPGKEPLSASYHIVVAVGPEHVTQVFPRARQLRAGGGAFELSVPDLESLNAGLAAIIERGALVTSVTPAYSSLESQFRQAVGESVS
ncbi:MAG: ABC transporter ATP-binding protein [Gemmatimonadaceae bacterium]